MTNIQIVKFIFVLSIIAAGVMGMYFLNRHRKEKRANKTVSYGSGHRNFAFFFYKVFTKTPILKRYFYKVKNKIETLYPADEIAVNRKATNYMLLATGASLACFTIIAISSKGDAFFLCAGILMTYVMFTHLISISLERLEMKLLSQFGDFLTDLRHYYHEENNPEDAVYATLDELPYELGLHINKIYNILMATDTTKEVSKYTDVAPNRFLMMFAAICSSIKEYGDTKLENGQSLFLKNLNYLKEELNIEILKKKMLSFLFSGLVFVSVLPIFLLKPIELWALSNLPELNEFYAGPTGTIIMAVIFGVTLICYQIICNLKDGHVDDMKENKFIKWLANVPLVKMLITKEINRNYSKSLKISDDLKMVGDKVGSDGFLLKRVIWAIAMVIALNCVIFVSENRTKQNYLNNFTEEFENSIVPNEKYRETMKTTGTEFVHNYLTEKRNETINRDTLVQEIEKETGMKQTFAEEVADVVIERVEQYKEVYYQWYYVLLNLAFAVIGFYIPRWLLLYQLSILKMNMEDEVVQFQTIVLILMYVDGMTIDNVLEWIERFAYCFKESISECILNLEYSNQKALQKMKSQETFPPFRRFVDNLMSVDDVGIVEAFDEVETEREYYKKKREQDNAIVMDRKAAQGKMISFLPIGVTIAGYLILPMLQMGITMMQNMNSALK